MTTVLHADENGTYKIVQLSLDTGNRYHDDVTMTIARISQTGINLARLKETITRDDNGIPEDPEKIALAPEEMDALVDAWTSFKSEQEARKIAEEERKITLYVEAYKLAGTVLTSVEGLCITIEADEDSYYGADHYNVRVPVFSYHRHVSVDGLLNTVEKLIEQTDNRIVMLEARSIPDASRSDLEAEYQAQIAAWRAVHPLPVVEPAEEKTEQGVTPEDIDAAESMMEV